MLLLFFVLVALIATAFLVKLRAPGAVNAAPLGWMSQQWLAEYRASSPKIK